MRIFFSLLLRFRLKGYRCESILYIWVSRKKLFLKKKYFRLPIIDPSNGNVLYIMTQKPMLKFLYKFFPRLDQENI